MTLLFVIATEHGHGVAGTAVLEVDVQQTMMQISHSHSCKTALKAALDVIAAFGSKTSDRELIVYYTGHSQDGNWLLPTQDQHSEVLAPAELVSMLAHLRMPVTIISDCCWSGKWCRVTHTPAQLRVIAASQAGPSYIGELLGQIATRMVSSKQCPAQKLFGYSYDSVLAVDFEGSTQQPCLAQMKVS